MKPVFTHSWNISEQQAIELQVSMAKKIIQTNEHSKIKLVAGVDVAYEKNSEKLIAAIVVLNADTLEVVETLSSTNSANFPYVPGLFSFREIPPLIKTFEHLKSDVDLIVCDAQGYAHPRRFGLACHLGLIFNKPTIGCGKTKLIGEPENTLETKRGSMIDLIDNGEVIGRELRSQDKINPVFVSIGHKIDLDTACGWVLKLSPKYRLPETTRQADQMVKKLLRA